MTLTFDQVAYSILLAEIAPQAIETEEEYERILAVAERLTFAKIRTLEEKALLKLLVQLSLKPQDRSGSSAFCLLPPIALSPVVFL